MAIKNIVFDLGGVLINLDFKKTAAAFTALGVKDFDQYFTQVHAAPLFKQLETGSIVNNSFYEEVRATTGITAADSFIDAAWNAMLLDFPKERIEKIQTLAKEYRLFLFSNTNAIHHTAFQQSFLTEYGFEFDTLFEKAWYSHLIGHRKPDVTAFEFILNDKELTASETLFIDDTLPNLEAAQKAGLHTGWVTADNDIIALLEELS